MTAVSLRDYDSVSNRIRHSRQSDDRPVLVVEGPSDLRFFERIGTGRWAIYPAGTRNAVATQVEEVISLGVDRVAGLMDRDFDNFVSECVDAGLPVVSFDEADLEACLLNTDCFIDVVQELASAKKLAQRGGVESLRQLAVQLAMLVGAVRTENALHGWGIDFESIDLIRRIDTGSLSLKLDGFSAVASRCAAGDVEVATIRTILETARDAAPDSLRFRGKDALLVVQLALKRHYGDMRIEDEAVLPAMVRLRADSRLLELAPFVELDRILAA